MNRYFTFLIAVLLALPTLGHAQENPLAFPPSWMQVPGDSDSTNQSNGLGNFADILRADMLKRFREASEEMDSNQPRKRPERPQPELGKAEWREDQPKSVEEYLDSPASAAAESSLGSATPASDPVDNALKNIPIERRMDYVDDLIQRRRYSEAEKEVDRLLQRELEQEQKINLLAKREKILFHQGHHALVEQDLYRLQAFFPEHEAIDELKAYIEEQSGITALQDAVLATPTDPNVQQNLVNQYMRYGWLDFAEEFFAFTIQDTSPATVKSLSEIYFRRQDFHMLVELSRKALELHPEHPDILYNLGVGLFHLGDPISLQEARTVFMQARMHTRSPAVMQNITWYLQRLPATR